MITYSLLRKAHSNSTQNHHKAPPMDMNLQYIWTIVTTYALKVVAALLIFFIGRWLAKRLAYLVVRLLHRQNVEITLVNFLKNIIFYAVLTAVVIAALGQLGINTTSFLTVIGAAGLAIGLALKDSLGNFSAGVLLILFRPFKVGDFITTSGVSGTVQEISILNTEMSTPDNQKVIVPNSSIMGNVITNVTANPTRRIDLVIGISYADDIAKAKDVLWQILKDNPRILKNPEADVAVAELAGSSVNLVVRPWVKTDDYWSVRFELTEEIKKGFDQAGISIPFAQQDVHLFVEKQG